MTDYNDTSTYEFIDPEMLEEFKQAFAAADAFIKKYHFKDINECIEVCRNAIVAHALGFDQVNRHKHGMDARRSSDNRQLENKNCSVHSKNQSATCNDTVPPKCDHFASGMVDFSLSGWSGIATLDYIIYGSAKTVEPYIRAKMNEQIARNARRTQTIGKSRLLKEYNFNFKDYTQQEQQDVDDKLGKE